MTAQELALLREQNDATHLPEPRGPVTEALFARLMRPVHALPAAPPTEDDPLDGEDAALALYCCYELHYRGFGQVDEGWEWEPTLLGWRRDLEAAFLDRVAEEAGPVVTGGDVGDRLVEVLGSATGPSLSTYLAERGSRDELLEFVVHRSAYQLKEADPHSWRCHG